MTPSGEMVNGDIKEQTHQVFSNLKAVLEEAGASFETVVKATVFIADMEQFAEVNEVYDNTLTLTNRRDLVLKSRDSRRMR